MATADVRARATTATAGSAESAPPQNAIVMYSQRIDWSK
jgi:hypothetical protein